MLKLYPNIKRRREELGLTQAQLAERIGYADKTMISKIEKGNIDLPQSKIAAIARALLTTPAALMGWIDETEPSDAERALIDGYLLDPKIRELVLFAGGIEPGENRDKYIDAIISAYKALMPAQK